MSRTIVYVEFGAFQLLDEDRFRGIDKIKTIGSTYMATIGLMPDLQIMVRPEHWIDFLILW